MSKIKKETGERPMITPRGGRLMPTGKFRLPDGTIRTIPELGIKNIKGSVPKKLKNGGAVMAGRGGMFKGVR